MTPLAAGPTCIGRPTGTPTGNFADSRIDRGSPASEAEIREALAGNLCRCTGYEKILDAVRLAAGETA